MINYKKAILEIKRNKIEINSEIILSINSINRVSSSNVYSPSNYPAANNSSFDGYAINSKETRNLTKKKFKILKTIAAGDNPKIKKASKYSTIEVMTGAIIQKPYNAVIPLEEINFFPNKTNPKFIIIDKKIKKNSHLRFAGSDYKKNDKIINKGEIIRAPHILAFKTLGIKKILVKKKPKIVFYTTGNEISNFNKIPNWKVRNSNIHYLKALLKSFPVNFNEKKIIRDKDEIKFKKELINNIKLKNDIVITSGAISKGKYDFIPGVVNFFKLKHSFKNVAIRPGKPIMFARFKKNMCFFGLPGNPISTAACFRFFVYPYLTNILNMEDERPLKAKLKNNYKKKKNFTKFLKCKISSTKNGNLEVQILSGQESYKIKSMVGSDVWGFFKSGKSTFKKGEIINCYSQHGLNKNIFI